MSAKTVAEKLFIKPGKTISFFNPPDNHHELLGEVDSHISMAEGGPADILLGYIENRDQLKGNLLALKQSIKDDGALWLAYHKQSSSVDTDINRDSIHQYAAENGLKGVGMISINDDWSAFRFKIID